jgi:hypothetical protein
LEQVAGILWNLGCLYAETADGLDRAEACFSRALVAVRASGEWKHGRAAAIENVLTDLRTKQRATKGGKELIPK